MSLTAAQLQRYARQIAIAEVGRQGQQKLTRARVLVVGGGGLGSPVAYYLAAAGIGHLGLIDGDVVSLSNLNRQILHNTSDLGMPKVDSARDKLRKLNPDVDIRAYRGYFAGDNAYHLVESYDLMVDATDNLETRGLMNDLSIRLNKPFFHAAVARFWGQLMTVIPGQGPCWRCFMGNSVMDPPQGGTPILGSIAGVVGSLQATQVLKYILGIGDVQVGKVMMFDGLNMTLDTIKVARDPACPSCGGLDHTEANP